MQQHKKYAWKIKTVQYDLKELLKKYLVKIIKNSNFSKWFGYWIINQRQVKLYDRYEFPSVSIECTRKSNVQFLNQALSLQTDTLGPKRNWNFPHLSYELLNLKPNIHPPFPTAYSGSGHWGRLRIKQGGPSRP